MAARPLEINPYLRRPLYVYDLPPEFLESLALRVTSNNAPDLQPSPTTLEESTKTSTINEDGISNSTSCALCQAAFQSVEEQRQHVRSDFHRYNLKLRVKGIPPVDEHTFTKQIGDLDESISGSDTSATDSDEEDTTRSRDTTLTALLRKQAKISASHNDGDSFRIPHSRISSGAIPMYWLSNPKVGDEVGLGVYRAILSNHEQEQASTHLVDILKSKQIKPLYSKQSGIAHRQANGTDHQDPHFFLCMIGGGHFAAAIIGLAPEVRKGAGGIEERHAIVKAHKTFHRYTTRRKQGGSQSANDNAKGNAHSAGSSIRRYNEIALEADVRNVLSEWKSMIDAADLLFIRASGTTSRRTLFGPYDGQILRKTDPRLRGFPFSTRRATQSELLRAFQELTRLKVTTFIPAIEEKAAESKSKVSKPKTAVPERSKDKEVALLHTSQLQNVIRRTKAPGMLLYLTKNDLSADLNFYPPNDNHHAPRPLHLAASINSPALIIALLTKAKANPTLKNDDGRTAYDIAGDIKTRDAFRVARHELGEDAWDWAAAHVPTGISPQEAEAKSKREQEIAASAEAERRKADLEKIRQQEEDRTAAKMERKAGAGKTLGAVVEKSGAEKREEETRGLTPEMRQRLERERRARAAEARMKAMSGGK